MIVAHRGFAHDNPENTLKAFHNAEQKADYIELDIHTTSDGVPIVHHDKCIVKNNRKYIISNMNYSELTEKFEYIPKLKKVCSEIEKPIVFEIKDDLSLNTIIQMYEQRNNKLDIIQSFNPEIVKKIRDEYSSDIKLSILCPTEDILSAEGVHSDSITDVEEAVEFSLKHNIHSINMYHKHISKDILNIIKSNNMKVGVWTIRSEEKGRKMKKLDIDYLITDSFDYINS